MISTAEPASQELQLPHEIEDEIPLDEFEKEEDLETSVAEHMDQAKAIGDAEGSFSALGLFKAVKKRIRSVLAPSQLAVLLREFEFDPFPTKAKRENLGKAINCPPRTIQIWFQNQRQKARNMPEPVRRHAYHAIPHPSHSAPLHTIPMVRSGFVMPQQVPAQSWRSTSLPASPTLLAYGKCEGLNVLVDAAMDEIKKHLLTKSPSLAADEKVPRLINGQAIPPSLKSITFKMDAGIQILQPKSQPNEARLRPWE